ncbi:MAG: hypothetical protein IK005_06470 [Paludibacteraceae bacterium]|nr:hypothetical protein [Paludibacteraceae bacterium]
MKHIITLVFCALLGITANAEQLPEWYYTTNQYTQLIDSIVYRYKNGDTNTQNEALNVLVKRMPTKKNALQILTDLARTNKLVGEPATNLFAELQKDPTNTKLLEFYKNNYNVVPETEFRELFKSPQVQNNTKARCNYEVILLKRNAKDFINIAIDEIDKQMKSTDMVLEVDGLIYQLAQLRDKKVYGHLLDWASQNTNKYVVSGHLCVEMENNANDDTDDPCKPMYASVSRFIVDQILHMKTLKGFPEDFHYKEDCFPTEKPNGNVDYICNDDKILSWCKQNKKKVVFNTPKAENNDQSISCEMAKKGSYESVDLGLNVLWATYNVGAENDTQIGCYFAWGETEPKNYFVALNYKYCIRSMQQLTKYNNNPKMGKTDGLYVLKTADDAAATNWGDGWHMPSVTDYNELYQNCDFVEVKNYKNSGLDGKLGTSKINGNTIFFPYTGILSFGNSMQSRRSCNYWTNTVCRGTSQSMAQIWNGIKIGALSNEYRNYGCCIRAVKNK